MLSFIVATVDTPEEKDLISRLYTEYRSMMYKISFNILKNRYDAEDAVHDAFLSIIRTNGLSKIKKFDKASVKPYIIAAAKNAAIKIYNKRSKQASEDIDEHYDIESGDNTEEAVFNVFEAERIGKALMKLPEKDYEILHLLVKNELSNEEIADLLGINAETVRQRIHRAKQRLLKILEGQMQYDKR